MDDELDGSSSPTSQTVLPAPSERAFLQSCQNHDSVVHFMTFTPYVPIYWSLGVFSIKFPSKDYFGCFLNYPPTSRPLSRAQPLSSHAQPHSRPHRRCLSLAPSPSPWHPRRRRPREILSVFHAPSHLSRLHFYFPEVDPKRGGSIYNASSCGTPLSPCSIYPAPTASTVQETITPPVPSGLGISIDRLSKPYLVRLPHPLRCSLGLLACLRALLWIWLVGYFCFFSKLRNSKC